MRSLTSMLRTTIGPVILKYAPRWMMNIIVLVRGTRSIAPRTCSSCGYHGRFGLWGHPPRIDARCPKCGSLERHRLFFLSLKRGLLFDGPKGATARVLHFAPETIIEQQMRATYENYQTADLFHTADLTLNMEEIALDDEGVDFVIANHVLEHVDDVKAGSEIFRILAKGGALIASVPLIEGWEETYEKPEKTNTVRDRIIHFGQHDHVRYFGRDFRDRITRAGFELESEITATGQDVIDHGLLRGDKLFIFRKPL